MFCVFLSMGCFMLSLALLFVLVFFFSVLFSIVITSLGEEIYVLLVRLFVYFAHINFCPFSPPLGCGL